MDELVKIIEGTKNFNNFWSKKKKNDCKSVELSFSVPAIASAPTGGNVREMIERNRGNQHRYKQKRQK